jgi:hypothetical protein
LGCVLFHAVLGESYLRHGKFLPAIKACTRAIDLNSNDPHAATVLAEAHLALGCADGMNPLAAVSATVIHFGSVVIISSPIEFFTH